MSESKVKLEHMIVIAQGKQELANQLTIRLRMVLIRTGALPENEEGHSFAEIVHACDAYLGIADPEAKEMRPC